MRELVNAALCLPGTVGWSGMVCNQMSSWFLNWLTVPVEISLKCLGNKLNTLAPCTGRLASLACLTAAGALLLYCATLI